MQVDPSPSLEPVGQCIYCGTTSRPLTKEHIVPRMLAGNITLPKASCDRCADVTKRIEGYMGRRVFHDLRIQHGFPMTEKPTHLPVLRKIPATHYEEIVKADRVLVPTKDHPGLIVVLQPEMAGIIAGRAEGADFQGQPVVRHVTKDWEERAKRLKKPHTLFHRELNLDRLGRFYAKVGLGFVVAACGVDGFENELGRVVLSGENWSHWVGGTTREMCQFPPLSRQKPTLHRCQVYGLNIRGTFYAAAQIQLITYFGLPIFTVIAGRLTESGLNRLRGQRVAAKSPI